MSEKEFGANCKLLLTHVLKVMLASISEEDRLRIEKNIEELMSEKYDDESDEKLMETLLH